ncbi:U-box domain-containing protein [Musa troglodytarum]|uniref:RING-type E3 ubiquitin transferase n=1 Tax=Musa troglodytarum TaxID=320322 RepID=A0A9E7G9S0_9LILI|nr:U-box domain-containing protein [Musa troglodytarum]
MGSHKSFWNFSILHRRSPSSALPPSSSTTAAAEMPVEFLCPISRSLMADPVIVAPSGHTFERSCIQACADFAFSPPGLAVDLGPSALVLIPNVALKSAILRWCERSGIPPPIPIPLDAARSLVRGLMPPSFDPPPATPPLALDEAEEVEKGEAFGAREGTYAYGGTERARAERGEVFRGAAVADSDGRYDGKGDALVASSAFSDDKDGIFRSRSNQNLREATSANTPPAFSVRTRKQASSSPLSTSSANSYPTSSSNSSFHEVFVEEASKEPPPPPQVNDPTASDLVPSPTAEIDLSEEEVAIKLMSNDMFEQESAVVLLRQATRESLDSRITLCTPRLLAALRPMILTHGTAIQIDATAALVNLSLEPANRVRIVKSGTVLPLVEVLEGGHPEARDHAAGALFSLALEDENRAAIGVLGAILPLLNLFSMPSPDGARARRDAGMALYYLSLASANRSKIARAPGAVRALLSVASEKEETPPSQGPSLVRLAMMVVCNLASSTEGRAALMDGGAVARVVSLMSSPSAAVEEYCVSALYGMSRGSLRFRGLARSAGAERVLMRVAEGSGGGGDMRQTMAKKTLRALRGEDDNEAAAPPPMGFPADDDGSVVSEGMMSIRRRTNQYGNPARLKTAEF